MDQWNNNRDVPSHCTALFQPMRQFNSLNKLNTAQLRARPYQGIQGPTTGLNLVHLIAQYLIRSVNPTLLLQIIFSWEKVPNLAYT